METKRREWKLREGNANQEKRMETKGRKWKLREGNGN